MTQSSSLNAADDLAGLLRKLRRLTKTVLQENTRAKQAIRKLRLKNAKLKSRLIQQARMTGEAASTDCRQCKICHEIVHPQSSCIFHPGRFYDVESEDQRELDSDSETFGMWSCCEAEEREAIGCQRSQHRFI